MENPRSLNHIQNLGEFTKKNQNSFLISFFFAENPDDIYPYATFILPEADCGAGNGIGAKIQISAYQQTPDSIRQQIVLTNPQDSTLMSSQPHISTLVFQEQSTLPLSDACSKSVSSNYFWFHEKSIHRGPQNNFHVLI